MSSFEFVFSLFGLLLGLALAQILKGFGNTLQERHKIKVGWLTPLLGLFVALDITSFWSIAWNLKDAFRPRIFDLLCGLLLTGTYYLSAHLVFPKNFVEWPDFDVYYLKHRRGVLGGVLLCNVVATAVEFGVATGPYQYAWGLLTAVPFFVPLVLLLTLRSKPVNIALLALLALEYPCFAVFYAINGNGQ